MKYSKILENVFKSYVFNRIDKKYNPIWNLVGTYKIYLFNYHPDFLNEFFYRITDDELPEEVMYDISKRFDSSDNQLNLILNAIPEMLSFCND